MVERLDKRDYHYSHRHRLYGEKTYMFDIDFVEFDGLKPVLAGDLKHGQLKELDPNSYQFRCYNSLFTCPVIALVYWFLGETNNILESDDTISKVFHTQYYAVPINNAAKKILENKPQRITEWDWVRFLHKLRHKPVSAELKKEDFSTTWKEVRLPTIK